MPRKTVRRVRNRPEQAAAIAGDGAFARIVDRAFENPAMSGGLMVMALTATAIMSNAMFLQKGRHPEPLFMTRPAADVRELPKAGIPLPRSRAQEPAAPAPAAAPMARTAAPPSIPVPLASPATLVISVQRELARLGLYSGAIDGLAGSRTRAAISAYQTAAGIEATGEATAELLAALKKPAASAAPMPRAALPPAVKTAADSRQVAAAVQRAAELEREQAALREEARIRRVQTALDQIGYGPLAADGRPSETLADSIRRFELDNGLPVTGQLGDRVTARLVAIGAMKAD